MNQEDEEILAFAQRAVWKALLERDGRAGWSSLRSLYFGSEEVEARNRLAALGDVSFVMPRHFSEAVKRDGNLVGRPVGGNDWECRVRSSKAATNMSKAISGVLRYEVNDWLPLGSLLPAIEARLKAPISFGSLFMALMADPARFQLDLWQGSWWARARYRHSTRAAACLPPSLGSDLQ